MEEMIRKGAPILCGEFEIIPIEKWTRFESVSGRLKAAGWTWEPLGIQVLGAEGRYALDVAGRRSSELLDL